MSATTVVLQDARRHRFLGPSMMSLARLEAVRMVRHPAFLLGVVVMVMAIASAPEDWDDGQFLGFVQATIVAMGMATFVTAALASGRQRFLAEPDLFPATPATRADRVVATALGLAGPALVTGALIAVLGLRAAATDGFAVGQEGYANGITPSPAEWLQPSVLVVLAGVVGICVAQLPRGRVPALLAVAWVLFASGLAGVWAAQEYQPLRVLHPLMSPEYERALPADFTPAGWRAGDAPLRGPDEWTTGWRTVHRDRAAMAWHLVYLAGLIGVGLGLATRLADRGEPAQARRFFKVGVPVVALAALAQLLTAGGGT